MMRYILPIIALMIFAVPTAGARSPAISETEQDLLQEPMPGTDVRWFIWGVPPEDVVKYEKVVLFEKVDNTFFFVDDVNGIKTLISYEFYKNRLWRVTYDFQKDDYPNPQSVIDDYINMEIMMNKRYGEPTAKETLWNDDYYKNKHNRWGLAVYNGHLQLRMTWTTPRTQAIMSLKAQDYDYNFRIVHTSRAIAAEIEKDRQAASLAPPVRVQQNPLKDTP